MSVARFAAFLAAVALGLPARGGVTEDLGLSEAEAVFCESEVGVIENRLRIFRAQGLPPAEQKRRNAEPQARLQECRARFRDLRRGDAEDEEVRAEVERRMPPSGGEVQRARIEREVRLERAHAKPPGALRPEDRRLLAEEAAAQVRARDEAERRRDPRFRRPALSAQLCRSERELGRLRQEQEVEARLAGVGGERNRVYYLRGEIHRVEEVAGDARAALARIGGPLPCAEPRVAEVARCLDLGPERARADEGCAEEEIDALVRSVR